MVRGLLGRGPGYTIFTPSRKPKKPKKTKKTKETKKTKKKNKDLGQIVVRGGAAMVVKTLFFLFFCGFLSAFLLNRKPEKDKRTRRWEEINMRN